MLSKVNLLVGSEFKARRFRRSNKWNIKGQQVSELFMPRILSLNHAIWTEISNCSGTSAISHIIQRSSC